MACVVFNKVPVAGRFCRNKPKKLGYRRNDELRNVFRRLHFPTEVMRAGVRWYSAYPVSLRQLEEMMAERGVDVDHANAHRWVLKILPTLAMVFCLRNGSAGRSGGWIKAIFV